MADTDITTRLRAIEGPPDALAQQAATEIDTLRAREQELVACLDNLLSWFGSKPTPAMQADLPNGLPAWAVVKEGRDLLNRVKG